MYKSMIKRNAKYLLIPVFCLYVYGKYSKGKNNKGKNSSVITSLSLDNIFDNDNNIISEKKYEEKNNDLSDDEDTIIEKNILEVDEDILELKEDRIKYKFTVKKNFTYKIMYSFKSFNLMNLKIKLVNSKREFIYNLEDYHDLDDGVNDFNFIMDNIVFDDMSEHELIFIFHKVVPKDEILFEEYNLIIRETNSMPNSDGIFIVEIDNLSYPYYLNTNKIMNVEELEINDFSDL
jgi:hypothetical protein